MKVVKETYPIIGMECAVCVKKIEDILKKNKGVISANANLASEKLTIEFDEETITKTELVNILSKAGYDLIVD